MSSYVMSIDVGTIGTKTAIYDQEGKLCGDSYQEIPIYYPRPGLVEQDSEDFYRTAVKTAREALRRSRIHPRDVAIIGTDGQVGGLVPVDQAGKPLARFYVPFDSRGNEYAEWMIQKHRDLIWETTANTIIGLWHAPKMLWIKKNEPRVYARTEKFLWANGYLTLRLTGGTPADCKVDYTMLPATMLYDYRTLNWSDKLCTLFGISIDKLPEVVFPWEIVGDLCRDAARDLGLREGTPIIAGAGDFASSLLGAGVVAPGQAVDVCGTASVLACCTDRPVPDLKNKTLECCKSVLQGQWVPLGCLTMGLNLRWFRDELSEPSRQEGQDRAISPYRILDEKAAQVRPGSGRLLFVPHFSGTRDPWRPNTRGVWFGLSWEHKRENLYRAMLESAAFEYYYYSLLMREYGLKLEEVRVTGGGARSDLWNQIKSDMLNVPYLRLAREEGASLGTAAIAAYAIGLTDDIAKTVCQWISVDRKFQPRRTYHDCYLKHYRVYERLIRELNGSFADLAGLPLAEPSSPAPE